MTAQPTGDLPAELQVVPKQLRPNLPAELRAMSKLDLGQRFRKLVEQRLEVSNGQKMRFPMTPSTNWAKRLKYSSFKGSVVSDCSAPADQTCRQGKDAKKPQPRDWAPFGPLASDSRVRYDVRQDWGLVLWAPLVLTGLVQSFRLGRQQFRAGEPPTAIALILWTATTWLVVTIYLPMAWDRYLMPPQSVNALLGALAISAIYDRVVHHIPLVGPRITGALAS